MKMIIKRTAQAIAIVMIVLLVLIFGINAYVRFSVRGRILTREEMTSVQGTDCIIVLGCSVRPDGSPSYMLYDRIMQGVECYNAGMAPKLLMSGDHGQSNYDEVNTMKDQAIGEGVPSSDIFMDHAGFSTYETMYRAKEIFQAKKVVIVTQKYHLYRAVYIAKQLGMDAYGVIADKRTYTKQTYREIREIAARVKDFFSVIVKPQPTYDGEIIPIDGDGNVTNDKQRE